jgi:23S rRNA (adenine2503-C2)-methyltransferase
MQGQIDWMVERRYGTHPVPARKFKIQFARMGEPALNPEVLEVVRHLPEQVASQALPIPCISTIGPARAMDFFERLADIRHTVYADGDFQLQFSIHSTDAQVRDWLMPFPRMDLAQIAAVGERFYRPRFRKVALNFAVMEGVPIDPGRIAERFDPQRFAIKLTPLNPTRAGQQHELRSLIDIEASEAVAPLVEAFSGFGFDVVLSIGNWGENAIGSNCGQLVSELKRSCDSD